MIINLLINAVAIFITVFLSWGEPVTVLPTVGGFDIDSTLVSGMGSFNTFITAFWPIKDMFYGSLVILAYFAFKALVVKFFLGSRTPG